MGTLTPPTNLKTSSPENQRPASRPTSVHNSSGPSENTRKANGSIAVANTDTICAAPLVEPSVDLDKIAAVIEQFPGVTKGYATRIDNILHGFYTALTIIDEGDLYLFLKRHLPSSSVPERYTYLAQFPRNGEGDIDQKTTEARALRAARTTSGRRVSSVPSFRSQRIYHPASERHASEKGKERRLSITAEQIIISDELSDFKVPVSKDAKTVLTLPKKNGFAWQRWLRYRALILYRKFFTFAIVANMAAAVTILYLRVKKDRYMLADIATATAANFTMAILVRFDPLTNLLFATFCSVPKRWPLLVRRHCARIYHISGLHSGCAIAATFWLCIFTIGGTLEINKPPLERCIDMPSLVLSYFLLAIFLIVGSTSYASFRQEHRVAWQLIHRYGGLTGLLLFWGQTFSTAKDFQINMSVAQTYKYAPPVWLLTGASLVIITPWLFGRKSEVRSEVLSSEAVRLHFDHATPTVGAIIRISERPLVEWHSFATITKPDGEGFSLVCSAADNFTKRMFDRPPSRMWIRGIPTCGVIRVATLFTSIVLVTTDSGIGACLGIILANKIPLRILWSCSDPERTFGREIVASVLDANPKAVIHNTNTDGQLDLALEAWKMSRESRAEAVFVVGERKMATKLVYEMESRGIPAYDSILDS